ncbi:MAG: phosphotransferase family protein, partial [Microbacterium sp.]
RALRAARARPRRGGGRRGRDRLRRPRAAGPLLGPPVLAEPVLVPVPAAGLQPRLRHEHRADRRRRGWPAPGRGGPATRSRRRPGVRRDRGRRDHLRVRRRPLPPLPAPDRSHGRAQLRRGRGVALAAAAAEPSRVDHHPDHGGVHPLHVRRRRGLRDERVPGPGRRRRPHRARLVSDERRDALAGLLATVYPAPVTITDLSRISAGASAQLHALTARDATGAEHALVLRTGGVVGGLAIGTAAEAAVLTALAGRSLPVPTVVTSFVDHPVLGDGYLMPRLDGETVPRRLLRDPELETARERIVPQAAAALAQVHGTAPDGLEAVLPLQDAASQVALLADLHRSMGQPSPTFELAFRWLAERLPPPTEPRLVHGDFRNGNLMVDADGLVAVLDWELAHLGDPLEDLGWFCAPAWRFGGDGEAGGFGPRSALVEAYAAATGT